MMMLARNGMKMYKQMLVSALSVVAVAAISLLFVDLIGYRSVALLLLATVSVLSIFLSLYPIFLAAVLSALIWDYFFIPPHFTFHIDSSEDGLLLLLYFVIAIVNGLLSYRLRFLEKEEYQKEERQRAIELYKTLFDSISHELRTPIATIVGASDNLLSANPNVTEEDKSHLIAEISVAAFRLNRLIDNLLNVQRLESGMMKTNPDWCDVNELINSPVNRLKKELSSRNVSVEVPDDFPLVRLDFGLIEQAIFNLVHNAILYTAPDVRLFLSAQLHDHVLELVVADSGKGFTSEELELLFTKFYRSKVKTTGGTGLGLSIVKGFVEAHGGEVKVENNVPHGARFVLILPVEVLELNDYLDFSERVMKDEAHYETLSETYIHENRS